jgi:hypothetical protein
VSPPGPLSVSLSLTRARTAVERMAACWNGTLRSSCELGRGGSAMMARLSSKNKWKKSPLANRQ